MNSSETAARAWLEGQGYRADDITYQYTGSPDFVTSDGLGWEVKVPVGRVIHFGAKQICDIRYLGRHTTVLIWGRDGIGPIESVDFAELTIPGEWHGYLLRAQWQPKFESPRALKSVEAVDEIVARYVAQGMARKAMPRRLSPVG